MSHRVTLVTYPTPCDNVTSDKTKEGRWGVMLRSCFQGCLASREVREIREFREFREQERC